MFTQTKPPKYIPVESKNMSVLYSFETKKNNPERTIEQCFSVLYNDGYFLQAIYSNLVEYDGFAEDGCYWYYPDMNSPYPEDRFEGVFFAFGFDDPDYTVYVSEEVCFEYTQKACKRFLELHPEQIYRDYLNNILDNWMPLNKIER